MVENTKYEAQKGRVGQLVDTVVLFAVVFMCFGTRKQKPLKTEVLHQPFKSSVSDYSL